MQVGTTLNQRYRIDQALSQKAGRQTFRGYDLDTQTVVIIKFLEFNRTFQWDDLKLFEREAKTLKHLDHPAIPKYLDYIDVEEYRGSGFALIQTYIDASPLDKLLIEGRTFSEAEIIELAQRLLDILIYLQEQNPPVIHRDIKPSNILVSNRSGNSIGEIYLVDFGSVQTIASQPHGTITIVGSYGYIPLEQFGGQTAIASDLYSLGMTLIYLLTGLHPIDLPSINGRVKLDRRDTSKKFLQWLKKMTEPHLDRRFSSAKVALDSLTTLQDHDHALALQPDQTKVELVIRDERLEIRIEDVLIGGKIISWTGCGLILIIFLNYGVPGAIVAFVVFRVLHPFVLLGIAQLIKLSPLRFLIPYVHILSIEHNGDIKLGRGGTANASIRWLQSSPADDISLLAYNPGYSFDRYIDDTDQVVKNGLVEVPPSLSIYAGHLEYPIGNSQLSKAELLWLGQELSEFLDLDMKIIYPTPKAPPEPEACGC